MYLILKRKKYLVALVLILICGISAFIAYNFQEEEKVAVPTKYKKTKIGDFWVIERPTHNIEKEGTNKVQGIVLHHTAAKNINGALSALCDKKTKNKVSAHVLIDKDGTRYVLADPTKITWHAGYSSLNGKDWCNNFTIGVKFHGNTIKKPLTEKQINSAIDYIIPILKKYNIKKKDIVTHEFIRNEWNRRHPKNKCGAKVDITKKEHRRFIEALNTRLKSEHSKSK